MACVAGCASGDASSEANGSVAVPRDGINVIAPLDLVTRVVDLQPMDDGSVWVLNSASPFFVVVGADGTVRGRFGEQGGGPQEFGLPWALVRGVEATEVWTYDVQRHALALISGDDRRDMSLPAESISRPSLVSFRGGGVNAAPPWIERSAEGFLLGRARVPRVESALQPWNADIVRIEGAEPEGTITVHLALADLLGDPAETYGAATVLLPYPLWTLCPGGAVALYDPSANELRVMEEGIEVSALGLPEPSRVPMTVDGVFEMFYRQVAGDAPAGSLPGIEELRQMTEEQNREFVDESTDAFPAYAQLLCTDGAFWLRRYDPTTGRLGMGEDWLRVTAGDVTSVSLPSDFTTYRIDTGRVWGTVRDSLNVESVAWIDLELLH